jgi:hypothetical protein
LATGISPNVDGPSRRIFECSNFRSKHRSLTLAARMSASPNRDREGVGAFLVPATPAEDSAPRLSSVDWLETFSFANSRYHSNYSARTHSAGLYEIPDAPASIESFRRGGPSYSRSHSIDTCVDSTHRGRCR